MSLLCDILYHDICDEIERRLGRKLTLWKEFKVIFGWNG